MLENESVQRRKRSISRDGISSLRDRLKEIFEIAKQRVRKLQPGWGAIFGGWQFQDRERNPRWPPSNCRYPIPEYRFDYSEKQFTLNVFPLLSPRIFSLFPFYVQRAQSVDGKKGERTRERFRDRSSPTPFLPKPCGKSRRRVRGRERKCINAARNVRDDEVAVYTLYRMHEIFGSRESPLLRRGKVYESPWKLTFFMDRRRGGEGRGNRDISARSHGLHRVKLGRSFGKKAAPSFRAGRRIDRGKEMIRFFCHDDPFFSGALAVTHYPPGGDILFDEENVRV